jgi:uncharacterized protein (DUF697 family)
MKRFLKSLRRNVTEIEMRTDLSQDEKVAQITRICSAVCAGLAVQPIPFADFFVLTPLQAYAGTRIAAIRGVTIGSQGVGRVIREILGAVGLGLLGQQMVIGAYKFIPVLGPITTIPLVYGATTAICSVMDGYFKAQSRGIKMTPEEMKRAWDSARHQGEREGRERTEEIWNDPAGNGDHAS